MKIYHKIGILASLIIGMVIISGCTSQTTTAPIQTATPTSVITTSVQTFTMTATTPLSIAPTISTGMISTTELPKNDVIKVTLNSAKKRTTAYAGGSLASGINILELDIMIQNYDKQKDFEYTDSSFVLSDNKGANPQTSKTTVWAKGMINPFIGAPISSGSSKEGTICFFVTDTSNNYKLSVVDSTGTVLTSINNIQVS